MPDQNTDAETKLRKLGERVRRGFTKENPISDRSLETVRNVVREQWERDQAATRSRPPSPPSPTKSPERKPEEPDQDR